MGVCSGSNIKWMEAITEVRWDLNGKIFHCLLLSKILGLQSISLLLFADCTVNEENPLRQEHWDFHLHLTTAFFLGRSFPQSHIFGVPQPSLGARMWSFPCPAQYSQALRKLLSKQEHSFHVSSTSGCKVERDLLCSKSKASNKTFLWKTWQAGMSALLRSPLVQQSEIVYRNRAGTKGPGGFVLDSLWMVSFLGQSSVQMRPRLGSGGRPVSSSLFCGERLPLIQNAFIEHLIFSRSCARGWEDKEKQSQILPQKSMRCWRAELVNSHHQHKEGCADAL